MNISDPSGAIASIAVDLDTIRRLIEAADRIAICAHTNPDGDALGSVLGMAHILGDAWPEKRIDTLLADPVEIPSSLSYLPGADGLIHAGDYTETPDLFICLDVPQISRLEGAQEVLKRTKHVVCIDHHPARETIGEVHIARTDAAAVGVVIAEFAMASQLSISRDAARCLLCAIMTDTGCFQYQNADSEALLISSYLAKLGADSAEVALHVYQNDSLGYLKLEALVLGRIETRAEGKIAYSWARMAELDELGVSYTECDGLIDAVRRVAGAEVVCFVRETRSPLIRGNLRSKGELDISGVAAELGGGGHMAAAGFSKEGALEEVLEEALLKLEDLVSRSAS